MSVQVDQISPYQKRLQFTVPGVEVRKKLDDAFRNLGNRVQIPGFRKGHVPRNLLEARWGKQLRAEVASELINWQFRQASVDIDFIGTPDVERADLDPTRDFSFSIVVQVRPEVTANDYVGMAVEWPQASVAEEVIEGQIQRRLVTHAKVVEVEEDRPVRSGDLVLTEITELADDGEKVIEAGTMINSQGDRYYPGVEALVTGLEKGGTATGELTVAGRTLQARVKVLGIQTSQVPPLTEELARELGFEGGIEGMRGALRLQEEQRANENARNVARVNLLRALIDRNPLTPPPAMVEQHLQLLTEELKIQQSYRGRDPRSIRFSDAQMEDLRERAGFSARAALLLEAVAKTEGIEVTDSDLEAKYQEIADMRGQRVEAIRGYFAKDDAVDELRRRILEERTLDWLLERAEVKAPEAGAAAPAASPMIAAPVADLAPVAAPEPKAKKPKKAKAEDTAPAVDAGASEGAEAPVVAPEAAAAEPVEKPKKKKAAKKEE
jgi:trigger factor